MNKENIEKKKLKKNIPFLPEIVGFVAVFILILINIFVLNKITPLAAQIKAKRSEIANKTSTDALSSASSRLERNKEKLETLEEMFVDDESFIVFIKDISNLKSQGIIDDFQFKGDTTVKDKATNYEAYPFTLTINGDITKISAGLTRIKRLPYIFRDIVIDIERTETGFSFQYGGYLYVKPKS